MNDMSGKVVVVTGATSGIGRVTARVLAAAGARIFIVARNREKAERIAEEIRRNAGDPMGPQRISVIIGNLSVMEEVRTVAERIRGETERLDALINNAGVFSALHQVTAEGNELTWAVNYLAPFLLTTLLLPLLKKTGTQQSHARVINVASDSHRGMRLDFDNLQGERSYNSYRAYGRSKLACVMFTYEIARRLAAEGANIDVNALHPGFVATGIGRSGNSLLDFFARGVFVAMRPFQISAEAGAKTSIYLASSPEVEGVTGSYFAREKPVGSSRESMDTSGWERLWALTEQQLSIARPTSHSASEG